jgi:hypothetical protein
MDHVNTAKPRPCIPSNPTPATISIQFTPAIIHPWYLAPIKQCLVCRTVYHERIIGVSDNFDLCKPCVANWEYYQKDSTNN